MDSEKKIWKIFFNDSEISMRKIGVPEQYIKILHGNRNGRPSSFVKESAISEYFYMVYDDTPQYTAILYITGGWGWLKNKNYTRWKNNFVYQGCVNLRKEKLEKLKYE